MSQIYRAELKESISRVVQSSDTVSYPIELTEILPPEEMLDLLKEQLKSAGWEAKDDNETVFVTEGSGGETLTLDLEAMELTATIETEREVVTEVTIVGTSERSQQSANHNAAQIVKANVEAAGDQLEDTGTKELQEEVTAQLAESETERQRAMHEILQRVYTESLKRKAGQLGDIMEISESTGEDGNYELTIRIEQ